MRSFYARLFKNLIGVYLCVLGCFAYITMMNAIPGHVYLEEGESLALDRMIPVSLAVQDDTRSVMSDIGEKTYRELKSQKPDAAVQQLAKGSHDVVCYLFGVFPIKEVEVSVVESRQVQAAGRVVGIYGATNGVLVLGSSPVETVDGSYREPAEHIVFAGDYITAVNGKTISEKEQLIEQVNETGANKMTLTVWRNGTSVDVALTPVETKEAYMLGLWVKDDMAGIGTLTYYDKMEILVHWDMESVTERPGSCFVFPREISIVQTFLASKKENEENPESCRGWSIMGRLTGWELWIAIRISAYTVP